MIALLLSAQQLVDSEDTLFAESLFSYEALFHLSPPSLFRLHSYLLMCCQMVVVRFCCKKYIALVGGDIIVGSSVETRLAVSIGLTVNIGRSAPLLAGICVFARCSERGRLPSLACASAAVVGVRAYCPLAIGGRIVCRIGDMTGHVYKKKRPPDGEPTEEERVIMHEGDASSSSGTSDVDRASESNTPPRFLSPTGRIRQRLDLTLHSTKAQVRRRLFNCFFI